jgi:Putative prokaryotic signal transducing protein
MPDTSSPGKNPKETPNPNEKLIRVFDTDVESEALVVHGLLESAGVESDITALEAPQDILPGVGGTVILVREEDEARARQLIEDYRRSPSEIESEEIDVNTEPASEG